MSKEQIQLFVTGTLKEVMDIKTYDSGFTKREFVLTTIEKYPQDVKFELTKEKTSLIDSHKIGDELSVYFNLRGNNYNGKYYNGLNCWKIETESATTSNAKEELRQHPKLQALKESLSLEDSDSLPF